MVHKWILKDRSSDYPPLSFAITSRRPVHPVDRFYALPGELRESDRRAETRAPKKDNPVGGLVVKPNAIQNHAAGCALGSDAWRR
jgi:hypothetical protein